MSAPMPADVVIGRPFAIVRDGLYHRFRHASRSAFKFATPSEALSSATATARDDLRRAGNPARARAPSASVIFWPNGSCGKRAASDPPRCVQFGDTRSNAICTRSINYSSRSNLSPTRRGCVIMLRTFYRVRLNLPALAISQRLLPASCAPQQYADSALNAGFSNNASKTSLHRCVASG